jgi:hypothetical protein
MNKQETQNKDRCADQPAACACTSSQPISIQPGMTDTGQDEVCCGSPPAPASSHFERPGYALCRFVEEFVDTAVGPVPRIKTHLDRSDHVGHIAVRWGINRNNYKIAPGLYCVGTPDQNAPVLVTANYKLTFDVLRQQLDSINSWILVLDTRGINVWCAAGKELFSTREVVKRAKQTGLTNLVEHRRLILPQLAATGVSAHQVKKDSGFKITWGPIRAEDIRPFLQNDFKADNSMRRVTFPISERAALVPMELSHLMKPSLLVLLGIFIASGIGSSIFSLTAAWPRGLMATAAYIAGIMAGALLAPLLLPWIPGRPFALKGAITGFISGIVVVLIFYTTLSFWETLALLLCTTAISSYLSMNFTGSTPFTSPSGVEKEMRKAIPMQAAAVMIAVVAWIGSGFTS